MTTLGLINLFTLAASLVVAHMLPPRLAALRIPVAMTRPVVSATPVLAATRPGTAALPTTQGLASMLGTALPVAATGSGVGVEVADLASGKVLYEDSASVPATPASTTKVVTAVTALAVLGPDTRFTTSVRQTGSSIVLVGGGDPTLAVNEYPSSDYPRPATLAALAAGTARALKAQGRRSVQLGYDTSLYSGPDMAPGWSEGLITSGNVTPVVSIEADQGRLTPYGQLEDSDDGVNFRPRTTDPVGLTMVAFVRLLRKDGIKVIATTGETTVSRAAKLLASVSSPPLSQIAGQMLVESNNVIAENLARHLAIAMGLPATFAGAAGAIMTEARRLGVHTPISLVDGSGLSPQDGIAPETLVRVLALAARTPRLRAVITGLPVAGFSGTLSPGGSAFGGIDGMARGMVRAKTGNLETVASLAGLAYDKDGRLLLFAIMAPKVPTAVMLNAAAAAIDTAAAGLAACGCR